MEENCARCCRLADPHSLVGKRVAALQACPPPVSFLPRPAPGVPVLAWAVESGPLRGFKRRELESMPLLGIRGKLCAQSWGRAWSANRRPRFPGFRSPRRPPTAGQNKNLGVRRNATDLDCWLVAFHSRSVGVFRGWWQTEKKLRPPYLFHHIPRPKSPQIPHAKRHNIKNEHLAVWNSFGIVMFGTRCTTALDLWLLGREILCGGELPIGRRLPGTVKRLITRERDDYTLGRLYERMKTESDEMRAGDARETVRGLLCGRGGQPPSAVFRGFGPEYRASNRRPPGSSFPAGTARRARPSTTYDLPSTSHGRSLSASSNGGILQHSGFGLSNFVQVVAC